MVQDSEYFKFAAPKASPPLLEWPGKQLPGGIHYHPVRCIESYAGGTGGQANRIYQGDNMRIMGSLLGEFRGKIDLIYIDPPFNSGIHYRKKIRLNKQANHRITEKQYSDVWKGTEYLQFMYERLILMRELLADTGSIYVHCDWHTSHHIRLLMDEVFGPENFRNEIAWCYMINKGHFARKYPPRHDSILFYSKTSANYFDGEAVRMEPSKATVKRWSASADENGIVPYAKITPGMKKVAGKGERPYILRGGIQVDWITAIPGIKAGHSVEGTGYPTQKPEKLIELFIKASSKPGDLVLDCFMGSGSAAAAAVKLGRRFIGIDSNPGAIATVTRRLLRLAHRIDSQQPHCPSAALYTGFEVYTGIETEGQRENAAINITIDNNTLVVQHFSSEKLIKKLNKKSAADIYQWQDLIEALMIDFNYDGKTLRPSVIDIPEKNQRIKGSYEIPDKSGTTRIKIIDVLYKSLEADIPVAPHVKM